MMCFNSDKNLTCLIVTFLIIYWIKLTNSTPLIRSQTQTNHDRFMDYDDNVQTYLMNFGYLPKSNIETGNLRTETQLRDAIRNLQKYGHIPETGNMDQATKELMQKPRCGVTDNPHRPEFYSDNRLIVRRKRYAVTQQKWPNTNLTWSLEEQSSLQLDAGHVRSILSQALSVWAKNSKLTFQEVASSSGADIEVLFASRRHGDGYDFDGPGQVLAHAFYPAKLRGGDVHFDADENWMLHQPRSEEERGTSLLGVAVHEFGHSLGLSHSSVRNSVMFPWYSGYDPDKDLPEDDRLGITEIYGSREEQWGDYQPTHNRPHPPRPPQHYPTTTTTTRRPYYPTSRRRYYYETTTTKAPPSVSPRFPSRFPTRDPKPNTCDTSYDAISVMRNELFIFKDQYLWRIGESGVPSSDYPIKIKHMWSELPEHMTHVDAVYENNDNKIVFFIGRHYYVFRSNILEYGYPKPLTHLGLPHHLKKIDAVLVWGHNKQTYFYSGTLYWRFDEKLQRVQYDYPRDMSIWNGIGYNIDAAFQNRDGITYFFKGKGYYRFNDNRMRVAHPDPLPSAQKWMGCRVKEGRRRKLPLVNGDYEYVDVAAGATTISRVSRSNTSSFIFRIEFITILLLFLFKFIPRQ